MGDNALNGFEIQIRRRVSIRQHICGIEDVEALVLHRSEIEIANSDNVEDVQVIFPAEHILVPAHGALQAVHCIGGPAGVTLVHEDCQIDLVAGSGDDFVSENVKVTGDQCKQIGRFWVRV